MRILLEENLDPKKLRENIFSGNYDFFSAKSFFGFDDPVRFFKMFIIFISLVLNIIIVISIIRYRIKHGNQKKKYSMSLTLNGFILAINFIHSFAFSINWIKYRTEEDDDYKIPDSSTYVGGLLVGSPPDNLYACQAQSFLLIFSSLFQDILMNIFYFIIDRESSLSRIKFYFFSIIGFFFSILITSVFLICDYFGMSDRYCYIKKYSFANKNNYEMNVNYILLVLIIYLLRTISLIVNGYFVIKIILYVKNHKMPKIYIWKSIYYFIIQAILVLFGWIYNLHSNTAPSGFSGFYTILNSLDGILLPFLYSFFNGVYQSLFCNNPDNLQIMSDDSKDTSEINGTTFQDGSKAGMSTQNQNVKDDGANKNNFNVSYE